MITDFAYYKRKANFKSKYSGIDDPSNKHSKSPAGWFANYPVQNFDYQFNSWGFRGSEYDKFIGKPVNICLGDSFTVNVGGPIEHSWTSRLQEYLNLPTLNLGMDGAGNDAIRLVYDRAIKLFDVQQVFVMYSHFHRRLHNKEFTHYGPSKHASAPPHSDEENFSYFEQQYIGGAYEAFLPTWCYKDTELKYIKLYENFDYLPGGKEKWANRDYNHMNKELNKMIADYYVERIENEDRIYKDSKEKL